MVTVSDADAAALRPMCDGPSDWDICQCEVGSHSMAVFKATSPKSKQPMLTIDLAKVVRAQAAEYTMGSIVCSSPKKCHFLELCIMPSAKEECTWSCENRGTENVDAHNAQVYRFRAESIEDVHRWVHSINSARKAFVSALECSRLTIDRQSERSHQLCYDSQIVDALILELNMCISMADEGEDGEEEDFEQGMELPDHCEYGEKPSTQWTSDINDRVGPASPIGGASSAALGSHAQHQTQSPLSAIRRVLDVLESITQSPLATCMEGIPSQSTSLATSADKSAAALAALEEAIRAVDGDSLHFLSHQPLQQIEKPLQSAPQGDVCFLAVDGMREWEEEASAELGEGEEGETLEEMMERWAARDDKKHDLEEAGGEEGVDEVQAELMEKVAMPATLDEPRVELMHDPSLDIPVKIHGSGALRLVYAVAALLAVLAAAMTLPPQPLALPLQTDLEVYEVDQVVDPLPSPISRHDTFFAPNERDVSFQDGQVEGTELSQAEGEASLSRETVDDLVADIQRSLSYCAVEMPARGSTVPQTWSRKWRKRLERFLRRMRDILTRDTEQK